MKHTLIPGLIWLVIITSGCAHKAENAREAAKPDAVPASAISSGSPILEVPEWFFDFGEVQEEIIYRHAFVIRNRGTAALEIKRVQAGCGTSVADYDRVILPGSEGKITFKLYPNMFKNGKTSRSLILTNDPRVPRFTVELRGKAN